MLNVLELGGIEVAVDSSFLVSDIYLGLLVILEFFNKAKYIFCYLFFLLYKIYNNYKL